MRKEATGYDRVEYYAAAIEKADKHFLRYTKKLRTSQSNAVELAWDTDSFDLLPVLALTVRKSYKDEDAFFRILAKRMITHFKEQLGDGLFFATLLQKVSGEQQVQPFYIYTVDERF